MCYFISHLFEFFNHRFNAVSKLIKWLAEILLQCILNGLAGFNGTDEKDTNIYFEITSSGKIHKCLITHPHTRTDTDTHTCIKSISPKKNLIFHRYFLSLHCPFFALHATQICNYMLTYTCYMYIYMCTCTTMPVICFFFKFFLLVDSFPYLVVSSAK